MNNGIEKKEEKNSVSNPVVISDYDLHPTARNICLLVVIICTALLLFSIFVNIPEFLVRFATLACLLAIFPKIFLSAKIWEALPSHSSTIKTMTVDTSNPSTTFNPQSQLK